MGTPASSHPVPVPPPRGVTSPLMASVAPGDPLRLPERIVVLSAWWQRALPQGLRPCKLVAVLPGP